MGKKAKLCMIKTTPPKSNEQIMEVLTTAIEYAKQNVVSDINVEMMSDAGSFHCSGKVQPPKSQG